MTDKVIKVNVTATKRQSVNISAGNIQNQITATPDSSQYYSNLSKNWAIGEGLIQGVDYSSKTYAEQAKIDANNAKVFSETAQNTYINVQEEAQAAITNINNEENAVMISINNNKDSAISAVNTAKNEAVNSVNASASNFAKKDLSNLSTVGQAKFDAKANKATTLSGYGITDGLNKSQITNCLLEVPQRIKYELNNGVITIKKGSVVIVPYGNEDLRATYPVGSTFINSLFKVVDTQFGSMDGVNRFFVWAEIQNDVTRTLGTSNGAQFLQLGINQGQLSWYSVERSHSGSTDPAETSGQWYDATNNYNKGYNSGSFNQYLSLPFAVVTLENGSIQSIDKVFNGFGYIGRLFWFDKEVHLLAANGRNNDGTLKNAERKINYLRLREFPSTVNDTYYIVATSAGYLGYWSVRDTFIQDEQPEAKSWRRWYKPSENQWYSTDSTTVWSKQATPSAFIAICSTSKGVVTDYNAYQPFRAVDYNDKRSITSWSLPSSKYDLLTMGANNSTYTAPANGYFSICGEAIANGGAYVALANEANRMRTKSNTDGYAGTDCNVFIPVKKGDVVKLQYINFHLKESYQQFVFIYAEGDK